MTAELSRRTFIRTVAAGGGGLVLGLWLTACTDDDAVPAATTTTAGASSPASSIGAPDSPVTTGVEGDPSIVFDPHLLLRIDGTGAVTVTVPKSEMGQGVRTALAMIVAEELDAEWTRVRVETAPADRSYGDQVTGGSLSVSTRFEPMRRIGALARHMLIAAAAAEWGIDPDECATEPGAVVERGGDRRAAYGELAELAASVEVPRTSELTLKDPAEFRIIGTPVGAIDAGDIVTGRAVYGSDVRLRDMAHGVVARPPQFGVRIGGYDAEAARAVPGVLDVVEISTGIAVVAETTYAALQGRDALRVVALAGDGPGVDDTAIREILRDRLDPVSAGPGEITAEYGSPFIPHSAMETLTCLANVTADRAEVWAATQNPQLAAAFAGRGSGLSTDQVTLHVPLIGGGFGRRLDQDFVEEAAELSAAAGRPVKLFWSRTDDLRHDRRHPAAMSRAVGDPADPGGARVQTVLARNTPVPTGDWRSVVNAPEAFARESFLDELAHAAGADPYEYRRELLGDRARAVFDRVAEAAGWGTPLTAERGRGIAQHATWGVSPTAIVAEVSIDGASIRVDRMVCAIDCGIVVNPDTVAAQLEGGIVFGLSAALLGGVTIDGGVVESNFADAPIVRFDEMPEVEVHIIESAATPTGVGEAAVPPVAPAIANAVFAATGRRVRDLPLKLG